MTCVFKSAAECVTHVAVRKSGTRGAAECVTDVLTTF